MRKTSLDSVYQLARTDSRIVFIGSDLGAGVMDHMKQEMPERFFMEGISEQHIIGMAAGLAMEGFLPFVNTIATFLTRRCFEQIAVDLCLQDLPVKLIATGAGAVYAPLGPTHLAIEDLAIMRALPNMTVVAPCDAPEMRRLINASVDWPHPMYIRLAKGGEEVVSDPGKGFEIGKAIVLKPPGKGLFVTIGAMTQLALKASKILANEGFDCGVMHMHTLKPLDNAALEQWLPMIEAMVTVEEHTRIGGLGSAILEFCSDSMPAQAHKIVRVGIPDKFANQYGNQETLLKHWGITVETLCEIMRKKLAQV